MKPREKFVDISLGEISTFKGRLVGKGGQAGKRRITRMLAMENKNRTGCSALVNTAEKVSNLRKVTCLLDLATETLINLAVVNRHDRSRRQIVVG